MQQEDDLRALAKIMEFGRAVSIFLLVVHVYVYCYPSITAWNLNRHFQLYPLDQAAGCDLTGNILPGNTWSQG